MKYIELTHGQYAKVDDCDFEKLNIYEWQAQWSNETQSYYAVRKEGKSLFNKKVYMHRVVMNTPKGMECDHIDHDTLNNQERNLRNVTHSQSQMNRKVRFDNQLNEKCIGIHSSGIGYDVCVTKNGKRVYRKYFQNLDDARLARDEAIKKHHGEFSYTAEGENND